MAFYSTLRQEYPEKGQKVMVSVGKNPIFYHGPYHYDGKDFRTIEKGKKGKAITQPWFWIPYDNQKS